ncbi:MAG: signal peptidase II [Steroidobacteraceae bacterium]
MSRPNTGQGMPVGGPRRGQMRWLGLSALVIALDQWTKHLVETHIESFDTRVVLPVFNLVRAYNRGAAFSMFNVPGAWQRWAFSALALGVSAALIVWLARLESRAQLMAGSLALILAGALGNLIDRLRLGMVVDFLQVHWHDHYFPAFNVADSAITLGAIGLLLDAFLNSRRAADH